MEKLVVGPEARDAIDITATVAESLSRIAQALGKDVTDLTVFVLEKPRHEALIAKIRDTGAGVRLARDGDVLGALSAAMPDTGVHVLMGVGGTPEGLIVACALKALGAGMQCRLAPQSDAERRSVLAAGIEPSRVRALDELVRGEEILFAATGVTGGDVLAGVSLQAGCGTTSSLLIRARTGALQFSRTIHRLNGSPGSSDGP